MTVSSRGIGQTRVRFVENRTSTDPPRVRSNELIIAAKMRVATNPETCFLFPRGCRKQVDHVLTKEEYVGPAQDPSAV